VERAREICLRQLHGRARSSGELLTALRQKQVDDHAAAEALRRLTEVGLVDDVRFAEDWIERHGRGKSRTVVQRDLIRKGIDAEVVRGLIAATPVEEGIELSLVARRWPSLRSFPDEVAVRRAAGLLARRGFDPGRAKDLVAELRASDDEDHPGSGEPSVLGRH
jgi:regulatory protein